VITASGGAILTFTPRILLSPALGFAGLLAFTGAGAVSRWGAGGIADRFGATTAIAPLLFIAALGLAAIGLRADSVHDTAGRTLVVSGLLLVGLAYGGLQNLTLTHAFAIAGEPARQSVSIAWNLSFDAGTGLGAFVVGAIATATSYSVAFGVLALAAVLTGGGWAWPGLAKRVLPGRECASHCDVGHRSGRGLSQSVIQPVITDAPSAVRNRSRNGPGGMGSRAKNPASSTGEVVMPALVCVSSVPGCGGTTWPSREPSASSSSMDRWAEVKVRARIVAVSDLAAAREPASVRES
jgi:MFS family permease